MRVTVQSYVRPIRLGFLVPPNDRAILQHAIELGTLYWGGQLAPIIPIYTRLPKVIRTV